MFSGINFYYIIFSASLHELSHFAAASFCGYKPKYFVLKGFGIEMNNLRRCATSDELLFISAAGPVMNLVLASVGYYFKNADFFLINISTAAINFLPCFPLDGGQFFYSLFLKFTSRKSARFILNLLCKLFGGILLCFGACVLIATKFNFSLLYIGAVVFLSGSDYIYSPIIEAEVYSNRPYYKSGVFVLNDSLDKVKAAGVLPANSIGAVKNSKGEIIKLVTPMEIYNELIH